MLVSYFNPGSKTLARYKIVVTVKHFVYCWCVVPRFTAYACDLCVGFEVAVYVSSQYGHYTSSYRVIIAVAAYPGKMLPQQSVITYIAG